MFKICDSYRFLDSDFFLFFFSLFFFFCRCLVQSVGGFVLGWVGGGGVLVVLLLGIGEVGSEG